MLLVCESVAGADTCGTSAHYKRDLYVCTYATCRLGSHALCDHPAKPENACLGDTGAAVNRSIIASGTEPPASFHVGRGKRSHSSKTMQGVCHDDACLPEPADAPRTAPTPRAHHRH